MAFILFFWTTINNLSPGKTRSAPRGMMICCVFALKIPAKTQSFAKISR
jgi:hypothetical protein